jgi:HAD superfamily hydrolase (TIGR01549 family)
MPVFLSKTELESRGEELERYRGELFKTRYLSQVRAFPNVRELFQRLFREGWKIALASSAKGDELQAYKDRAQISDLLDTETSSDDVEKSKPYPDIFQAALHRLNLEAKDCAVVGDSPYDAQAASKAGICSIGFLCGGFPRNVLETAGFRELYQSPADLLANFKHSLFYAERPVAV